MNVIINLNLLLLLLIEDGILGNLFLKLGFKLINIIKPTYYYVKNKKRYNKKLLENNKQILKYNKNKSLKNNILNNRV